MTASFPSGAEAKLVDGKWFAVISYHDGRRVAKEFDTESRAEAYCSNYMRGDDNELA